MQPFLTVTGVATPLDRANVDTDQIIPKQFLKRIERTGFGQFLFYDWRYEPDGVTPNPEFELNHPAYADAPILLAGRNFGSGSSREHAPWALADYGFRCIIAPSYADIFYSNCFQNGILPVTLAEDVVAGLLRRAQESPGYELTVNLIDQLVTDSGGLQEKFEIDAYRRHRLLNGLDDIGTTLQHQDAIGRFEQTRPAWSPTLAAPV